MQKVIKIILLTTLAITTTLFIAGCSQVDGNALKKDANLIVDVPKENEQGKEMEVDKRIPFGGKSEFLVENHIIFSQKPFWDSTFRRDIRCGFREPVTSIRN